MYLSTGFGALCPNPQILAFFMFMLVFLVYIGLIPFPSHIFSKISNILLVPILHGVHFPQDSSTVNSK